MVRYYVERFYIFIEEGSNSVGTWYSASLDKKTFKADSLQRILFNYCRRIEIIFNKKDF